MSRPNLISKLHALKYELRRPRLKPHEVPRLIAQYEELVRQACSEYRCSKAELLRAIAPDFGKWVREEKLPWIEEDPQ